jgi:hypothetical protein
VGHTIRQPLDYFKHRQAVEARLFANYWFQKLPAAD